MCLWKINSSLIHFNFKLVFQSKIRVLNPQFCFLQWKRCHIWIRRQICTDQSYSGQKWWIKFKCLNYGWFLQIYINWFTGVVWITCGLLWCFYQMFGLSFWRHPFTAEDPLVSKWCNYNFSKSILMKKQTHLYLGWSEGEYIFRKCSLSGKLFF